MDKKMEKELNRLDQQLKYSEYVKKLVGEDGLVGRWNQSNLDMVISDIKRTFCTSRTTREIRTCLEQALIFCNYNINYIEDDIIFNNIKSTIDNDILDIIEFLKSVNFSDINIRDLFTLWIFKLPNYDIRSPLVDNDLLFKKFIMTDEKKRYAAVIEHKEESTNEEK